MGLANSLRERIQDNPLTYGDAQLQLRASFGVAVLPPNQDISVKDMIGRADKALYAAKEAGRNRVVAWEELSETRDEPAAALAGAGAQ